MQKRKTVAALIFIAVSAAFSVMFALLRSRLDITVFSFTVKYYFLWATLLVAAAVAYAAVTGKKNKTVYRLVLIAVFSALAVASRAAFAFIPQVKPVLAVVIAAGVSLGAGGGFAVGCMSMLVSNFFFGQGVWTPFQMLAAGLCGLIAGLLFSKIPKKTPLIAFVGALLTVAVYGVVMNTYFVLFFTGGATWQTLIAAIIAGLPFDLVHAAATAVFLLPIAPAAIKSVLRATMKFGL